MSLVHPGIRKQQVGHKNGKLQGGDWSERRETRRAAKKTRILGNEVNIFGLRHTCKQTLFLYVSSAKHVFSVTTSRVKGRKMIRVQNFKTRLQ